MFSILILADVFLTIANPSPTDQINTSKIPDPENWIFETAREGELMPATHAVRLNFRFDDSEQNFTDEFIILPGCAEELIVGATTMQKWQIKLDFEAETITYRKTASRLRV